MTSATHQQPPATVARRDLVILDVSAGGVEVLRPEELAGEGEDDQEDKDRPRRFSMLAYTGATVPRLFGPAVFDTAGIQMGAKVPILLNHDEDRIAGFADRAEINDKGELRLSGVLSQVTMAGREVARLSDEGFPWQASVGLQVNRWEDLAPGETAKVNGREVLGPMSIGRQTRLLESSFLPAGADGATSAVALSRRLGITLQDEEGDEKGEEGQGTGDTARRLIREAEEIGFTQEEIGEATNRSAGVIGDIKSGEIKNPPTDLIDALRRLISSDAAKRKRQESEESMVAQIKESLAAFPEEHRGWAAQELLEGKEVVEVLGGLVTKLREENTELREKLAAHDERAEVLAKLRADAGNPGVGFNGQEREDPKGDQHLTAEEKARKKWDESPELRREFAGKLSAYMHIVRREIAAGVEV